MKKDVVYIDIEDDITAVIEKLRASKEKIVAMVPPKGNQVLHSVVNLKLLKRAAESAGVQPVLVTNNNALKNLAGSLNLYVAKNLQSKPAIPSDEVSAIEDDMQDTPVDINEPGESVGVDDGPEFSGDDGGDEIVLGDEDMQEFETGEATAATDALQKSRKSTKPKKADKKLPNFDHFRKKILIAGGVLLVLLLICLSVFGKTKANIVVRAETTPVDVAFDAKFDSGLPQSDPVSYNLKAIYQESKKSISEAFTPTGQKDLGTKASGTVSLKNCRDANGSLTIPAGTGLSSGNLTFLTSESVTLPESSFSGGGNCKTATRDVQVSAQNNGDQYNLSPRNYNVSGFTKVNASGSQMSGGTSQVVKIVTQEDVDKAKASLSSQDSTSTKNELKRSLGEDVYVFEDSFSVSLGEVRSEPAVGEQTNEARLTGQVTYSMIAVKNEDLKKALSAFITTKMTDAAKQQVYVDGLKTAQFTKTGGEGKALTYKVVARGQFGPQFDTEELKKLVAGKKAGEVRATLQDLPGVKSVDIHLSPFWASKTPNVNRINLKVDVDENVSG